MTMVDLPTQSLVGGLQPVRLIGHHGLGDNLHQRAIMRQLIKKYDVWLDTSWVSLYHDLIAEGLHVIHRPTSLRTQTKNARREMHLFEKRRPPPSTRSQHISYGPDQMRQHGSVLGAMCAVVGLGCDYETTDFRLPIPEVWRVELEKLLEQWKPTKPLMIFRPPCVRPEWGGAAARNPDPDAYAALYREIRDRFFVVSVADIESGKEWIAPGGDLEADVKLHHGELVFEVMAALFAEAALVFSTGGFAVILAQAVETPVFTVIGGYEDHTSYSAGARYSPYGWVDPIRPYANCSHSVPAGQKAIDLSGARARLLEFMDQYVK
jgi:ADP-heptose:LPS heptosyltransferase